MVFQRRYRKGELKTEQEKEGLDKLESNPSRSDFRGTTPRSKIKDRSRMG